MMKSSRRKQTNPNRVTAGDLELDSVMMPHAAATPVNQKDRMDGVKDGVEESCSPQPLLASGQSSDCEIPINMHVATVSGNSVCADSLPSQKTLEDHEAKMHGSMMKKPRMETASEDFPTAYHRLGRQLLDSTDAPLTDGHMDSELMPTVHPLESTPSPRDRPDSASPVPQASGTPEEQTVFSESPDESSATSIKLNKEINGEIVVNKADRIFHMDAYCDLCDREFCNKYFLKTHKANKHGIYEDSPPPANNIPLPFPGLIIPQDPLATFNFKMDSVKPSLPEPLLPWSFKLDPSSQVKRPDSTSSMKSADSQLSLFPLPVSHAESPKSSVNKSNSNSGSIFTSAESVSITSSSATSILSNITNSIASGVTSTNPPTANDSSMEDYCHICQKHFCNKYYLRKHKQDVHGIAPEHPTSNSSKRSRSVLLDLPITSSNHIMLPQPLASLAGMHSLPGLPGLPNVPSVSSMTSMHPGVMVINPYSLPPVAIIPAGSLMPGQQLPPHPSHPHRMLSQSLGMSSLSEPSILSPAPVTSTSSILGSQSSTQSPKTSPNIGESGVHCNICSKEFCNEFYLQIHKESKHAIRKPNEEESRDKALSLVKEKSLDNGSPLSNIGKTEPFPMVTRSSLDRAHTGEGSLFVCNFCNKDFSNKYLYRIHRIHDHGMNELIDPTLVESGELSHRDHFLNNMNESLRMATDVSAGCYTPGYGGSFANKPQENVVCDICHKQITNQYFLRLHKFNVHGIDPSTNEKYTNKADSSAVPPASKPKTPPTSGSFSISSTGQQSLNITPVPGKPPMLSFLPPKLDFKDMPHFPDFSRDFKNFRDLPPFLADSINSDLFSRSQNHTMHMDLNFFGLPSLGKLPMDDNVKLNFDPEAYCEICKKEFCSKYFLRTHKQNIHGIKSDATLTSNVKSADNDKYNTSPQKSNMNSSNGRSRDGMDKNCWRWKEPMNSSRVICDICNKEVCNKYFLRTHKQKKHGKLASSLSPNVSVSGSPVASDCDTASNASSQPDEKMFKIDPAMLPQSVPLPPTEQIPDKLHIKSMHFTTGNSSKDIPLNNNNNSNNNNNNNSTEQYETCNICNRMFKNLKWLKEHIMKDHSDTVALDMSSKTCPPVYTCQVCGFDCPSELSVQLHLIQEHNARVTLDTEESQIPTEEASLPVSEGNSTRVAELYGRWTLRKKISNHQRLKKYVCNRCGFDSHWLSSLLDHERTEHGFISDEAPSYSCKICRRWFSSLNSLSTHLVTIHELTMEEAFHEVKYTEPTFPNTFKCAHCPAVFPTRSWGMAHVRHVHIRSRRDLAVKNSFVKNVFRCSSCSFKTHFAFRLQQHIKCRHASSLPSSYNSPGPLDSDFKKSCDVPSPDNTSREDNSIVSASSMYKSIAASLLSAPECDRAQPSAKPVDTDALLLHSYRLPICSSPVDAASFKMASAVVGL